MSHDVPLIHKSEFAGLKQHLRKLLPRVQRNRRWAREILASIPDLLRRRDFNVMTGAHSKSSFSESVTQSTTKSIVSPGRDGQFLDRELGFPIVDDFLGQLAAAIHNDARPHTVAPFLMIFLRRSA